MSDRPARARARPRNLPPMPPISPPTADEMLTPSQQAEYLEALADPDVTPDVAADKVGLTGTRMRALRKRDIGWDNRCREVEQDRKIARAVAVVEEAFSRGKVSDRILEVLLATYGPLVEPGFAHLRRDRMNVKTEITGIQIVLDADTLEQLPLEQKKQLRDTLAKLGGRMIEPGQPDIEV